MQLPKAGVGKYIIRAPKNSHPHHLRPSPLRLFTPPSLVYQRRRASITSTHQFTGRSSLPLRTPLSVPQAASSLLGVASYSRSLLHLRTQLNCPTPRANVETPSCPALWPWYLLLSLSNPFPETSSIFRINSFLWRSHPPQFAALRR